MSLAELAYLVVGISVEGFLILLAVSSALERKGRAVLLSSLACVLVAAGWYGWHALFTPESLWLSVLPAMVLLGGLVFFLPFGSSQALSIGSIREQVDERDVAFSREEYQPGTEHYETYYAAHPEHKAADDRMRRLRVLLEPGGRYYDKQTADPIEAVFDKIVTLATQVDGQTSPRREEFDAAEATAIIEAEVLKMGADEVGIAELNPMFVYSHVGRGPEPWGQPIVNNHRYAIVFALEMDYYEVEQAPRLPITRETAKQYLRAGKISVALAKRIRERGYAARAHIAGSNYQIMLPPVAHDAGLGELGRMGYLISPKFGARIRLGGITTDLPLVPDTPITFGVQDFCDICLKCSVNCPSGAIPVGGRRLVREVEKWPLNVEKCIHYWRAIGTDCGLCMKVCPYSRPSTPIHNLVRAACRRSSIARRLSVWADDLFYGRKLRLPSGPA